MRLETVNSSASVGILEKSEVDVEDKNTIETRIMAEMKELGVSECPQSVINHLIILEQHSNFNDDSRMVRDGFKNILLELKNQQIMTELSKEQIREGLLAAFIHDIGKSSPSEDPSCQLDVIRLF